MRPTLLMIISTTVASAAQAALVLPVADVVSPAAPAALHPLQPSAVRIDGWLGARIDANETHRLLVVDTEPLLAGYQHRPGDQPWIGEHVGKWMHAATLAWAYSGDEALRRKLDTVAASLIATQEADGYLGTYEPGKRFGLYDGADWDVWCHKYNLIGLLTYYRYTGNEPALAAARRIGDLLVATFPAKRSILAAGTHMGMAATSVLSPMVDLYKLTGDPRYLEFARYIVRSYEEKDGPDIVRALLAPGGSVQRVANGKAYEMLSNLVGLTELHQVTGDHRLLQAVENGWTDIVRNRLYLTGTASIHELFGNDHELPDSEEAHMGETCVTTTWIQFNAALLAQTGEAKYGDEIERSLYNQLTAAQNPGDGDWCYYTPLDGIKHFDQGITCCHSSGPRALALAPTLAYLQAGNVICVNTLETSRARLQVPEGSVEISQESQFPYKGRSTLTIRTASPARLILKVRAPGWAEPMRAGDASTKDGWVTLPERVWNDGDQVTIAFNLSSRVIQGDFTNYSRVAYAWGPYILALDRAQNSDANVSDSPQFIRTADGSPPTLVPDPSRIILKVAVRGDWDTHPREVNLVPFADAGLGGKQYAVWLRAP
jgi:uncharacterized protein